MLRPSHVAFAGGTWLGTIPTPRVATAFGQAWRRRLNVKQRGMHRWQLRADGPELAAGVAGAVAADGPELGAVMADAVAADAAE